MVGLLHCTTPPRPAPIAKPAMSTTPISSAPSLTVEVERTSPPQPASNPSDELLPASDDDLDTLVVLKAPTTLKSADVIEAACYETRGYLKQLVGDESGKNELFSGHPMRLPAIDVDADGKPDKIILIGATRSTHDLRLLLVRTGCVVPVGEISAFEEVRPLGTFHHGLRDLNTTTHCDEISNCDVDWHFDGKNYVQVNPRPSKRKFLRAG